MKKHSKIIFLVIILFIFLASINTVYSIILEDGNKFISGILYNYLDNKNVLVVSPKEENKLSYSNIQSMFKNYDKNIKSIKDKNNNLLLTTETNIPTGAIITTNDNEEFQTIFYGDSNGDGIICSSEDIDVIKNDYLNKQKAIGVYKIAADLCVDNKLNVKDIQRMLLKSKGNLDTGLIEEFPDEDAMYSATFIADDKEVAKVNFTVKEGLLEEEPKVPEKDGYTGEWNKYELTATNITVEAKYTPIVYDITYETNGGTFEESPKITYTVEDENKNLPIPEKANYVFEGWYETANLTGSKVETTEGKLGDLTLYAKYEEAKYKNNLNKYYLTLKSAMDYANTKSTVTTIMPLVNVTETDTPEYTGTQSLTLNLNAKTIALNDVTVLNKGILTINGSGKITSTVTGIENMANGRLTVSNITIETTKASIRNYGIANTESQPAVKISSGTIKSTSSNTIVNHSTSTGWIVIAGGNIISEQTEKMPTVINYQGKIIISGGEIISNKDRAVCQYQDSKGIIEIRAGTISGVDAVTVNLGKMIVKGGTITGTSYGAIAYETGILTIGNNEDTSNVSITNPSITGTTSGVSVGENATFNFYGGIIKGPAGSSISGTVSETRTGYVVVKGEETIDSKTYETSVLGPSAPVITAKLTNSSGATYTPGTWANQNVYVSLSSSNVGAGIKEYQWYDNGEWVIRALSTTNNKGTITYTANRHETLRFRAIDNNGVISKEATIAIKIDKNLPTVTLGTNGGTYTIPADSSTVNISTKLTASDEGGSELKSIEYAWSQSKSTEPTNYAVVANNATVTKAATGGNWYLWTKVLDNAGNRATSVKISNEFTVKYQIAYNANGGSGAPSAQTKIHGTALTLSETIPTRTGYTFKGWATSKTATTAEYQAKGSYTANSAKTLYAVWVLSNYTVTYNSNIFSTYNKTQNGLTFTYDAATSILTINGTWSSTSASFGSIGGLDFALNDKYYTTLTYQSGSYTSTVNPTFVFDFQKNGANYSDRVSGTHYKATTYPTSDSITASMVVTDSTVDATGLGFWMWQKTAGATTFTDYKVKINVTKKKTQSITYNSNYSGFPTNPVRIGYTFKGWYTAETGGTAVTTSTKMTTANNHTIYAQWNINKLTIRYHMNGGALASTHGSTIGTNGSYITVNDSTTVQSMSYGSVLGTNGLSNVNNSGYINIVKTGYHVIEGAEFNTKSDGTGTTFDQTTAYKTSDFADLSTGSKTLDLYVNWKPNTYTISYDLAGGTAGTNKPTSGTYNSDVQISNPSKTGYTFLGWTSTTANGLGGNAKTGTAANPSTAWTGSATKNTYFRNLTNTNAGTVKLTATWSKNNYQNTNTSKNYVTLASALNDVATNQTIKVLDSVTETTAATLASGKTAIIDLNGKTVTLNGVSITNNGTLTVTGTSGTLTSSISTIINGSASNTSAKFTKSGACTITGTGTDSSTINNFGTATLSSGTVSSTNYKAVYNHEDGKLTVLGGTITAKNYTIFNKGTATGITSPAVKVTGGTVTSTSSHAIRSEAVGTIYLTGGTIDAQSTASTIYTNSTSEIVAIQVSGATVKNTGTNTAINNGSTGLVKVTSGKVSSDANRGVYNTNTGTIEITGGTITSSTEGIYNNGQGKIKVTGGTITSSTASGINGTTGTVTIYGNPTITGSTYGVVVTSGTATITATEGASTSSATTGPTIVATGTNGYGYYASTGTITLGASESTASVSTTYPIIKSNYKGIATGSTGRFNFYDGVIYGKTSAIGNHGTQATQAGYGILLTASQATTINGTSVSCERATLASGANYLDNIGSYYNTLYSAMKAASGNTTITTITSQVSRSESVAPTFSGTQGLTFNLNGKTITMSKTITNSGTLTISGSGTLTTSSAIHLITNSGTLNLTNTGMISNTNTGEYRAISNTGTVNKTGSGTVSAAGTSSTIAGGAIKVTAGTVSTSGGIAVNASGTFTMSGGTISSTAVTAVNVSGSTVTVSGGIIQKSGTTTGATFQYSGTGTATLSGGTIKTLEGSTSNAIFNNGTGTIKVNGATIQQLGTGYGGTNNSTGTIEVMSGNITASGHYGLRNVSTGTIKVTGGTIEGTVGVFNDGTGTVNISGANTKITGRTLQALRIATGTATVTGGTLISKTDGVYLLNEETTNVSGSLTMTGGTITAERYGIFANGICTITIGDNSNAVSKTTPSITGDSIGIYCNSNSTFNFYDGIIRGPSGKSISGTVSKTPTGYTVRKGTATVNGTSYETSTLGNTYTVTYNYSTNGGTSATKTTATVAYGAAIDFTPTATKEGWTFVGWNTDKAATTKLTSKTMGTSNVTLYAIYSKKLTGTFKYYNNQTTTKEVTIYNTATSGSITSPAASGTPSGYTFRHWSTSSAADGAKTVAASTAITISANTTYYASYQKTVTGTFYYCTLDASAYTYTDAAQSSKTATATQYIGYTGTIKNSNFTVPTEVTSSTGGASAETYKGVATAVNSGATATPTTANTKFYAVYSESLTFYYYNGSSHTSKAVTRRMLSNGTKYSNSLSENAPTPSAYDGATFVAWSYDYSKADSSYRRTPLATGANNLYAIYEKSVSAKFYYNSNTTSGSLTASNTSASGTKSYVSKSGGVNTINGAITVPAAVTGSKGKYNAAYRCVATAVSSTTSATATTANTTYYAVYSTAVTVYYPTSTTAASNVKLYRNEYFTSTTAMTTKLGSSNTATTEVTSISGIFGTLSGFATAVNSTTKTYASIAALRNSATATAYALTTSSVTATMHYYDGSAAATTTGTGTRTNYCKTTTTATVSNGTLTLADSNATANRTISSVTYTFRGWSTSSAGNASSPTKSPTTASTTYYASYSYSVKIEFNGNGASSGTAPTALTGTAYMNYAGTKIGASITLPANPFTRNNFTFAGWNTAAAGTGTNRDAGKAYTFTESDTLYAKWNSNNYQNTNTSKYYVTLASAFSDAATNQTIKVLKNPTETSLATVSSSKSLKLSMNSKKITMSGSAGISIANSSNLSIEGDGTITSSSTTTNLVTNNGKFAIAAYNGTPTLTMTGTKNVIYNNSQCILSAGTIKVTNTTSSSPYAIYNNTSGNINILNGVVNAYKCAIFSVSNSISPAAIRIDNNGMEAKLTSQVDRAIYQDGTGAIDLENGIISNGISVSDGTTTVSNSFEVFWSNGANVLIDGATIETSGTNTNTALNMPTGTFTMSSGTITSNGNGVNLEGSASHTISGGTITSKMNYYGLRFSKGSLTINDGTITGGTGILNESTGTLRITNGDIWATSGGYAGIQNTNGGTINIYGGKVSTGEGASYGIKTNGGTINLYEKSNQYSGAKVIGHTYGIGSEDATQNVIINVGKSSTYESYTDWSDVKPYVGGYSYAVVGNNKTTINWNNGVLWGNRNATPGVTTSIYYFKNPISPSITSVNYRTGYDISIDTSGGYHHLVLKTSTTSLDSPSVASEMYNNNLIEEQQIAPMQNSTIMKSIELPQVNSGIEPPKSNDEEEENSNNDIIVDKEVKQPEEILEETNKESNIVEDDIKNKDDENLEENTKKEDNIVNDAQDDNKQNLNTENLDIVDKNSQTEVPNSETMNKNSQKEIQNSKTMNKNAQIEVPNSETMNKNSQKEVQNLETMNKTFQTDVENLDT